MQIYEYNTNKQTDNQLNGAGISKGEFELIGTASTHL